MLREHGKYDILDSLEEDDAFEARELEEGVIGV